MVGAFVPPSFFLRSGTGHHGTTETCTGYFNIITIKRPLANSGDAGGARIAFPSSSSPGIQAR
jgi:hypothetical protein